MRNPTLLLLLLTVTGVSRAAAQWVPTGSLAGVPVSIDCERTANAPARTVEGPQVFTCPEAAAAIDAEVADAAHFFLVHEFGVIALDSTNASAADCWAARQVAAATNGERYIVAVVAWLDAHSAEFDARIGTDAERADRIRECSGLEFPPVVTGARCCTDSGGCDFLTGDPAKPLGASCYCVLEDPDSSPAGGTVCSGA